MRRSQARRGISSLVLLLGVLADNAWSQSTPVIKEIIVTGERPAVETRVDRKVYAVSQDLQGTLGTAVDVLRNVPSISLDIEGNPSLRGDADVAIFIDGRFAPAFNGTNRGAALQQLAADGIERIEVITNPPANFKREGTAGVINIITRRKAGSRSATARASIGSRGRYNVGTSQSTSVGKLEVHGSATVRRDLRIRGNTGTRTVSDADSGAVLSTREIRADGEDDRLSKSFEIGADYAVGPRDTVSAEASFSRRDSDVVFRENAVIANSSGTPISDYRRTRRSREHEYESDVVLSWLRKGERDGDGIKLSYQRSAGYEHRPLRYIEEVLLPPQDDQFQRQGLFERGVDHEVSLEIERSFDSNARLILGYDLERQESEFDAQQTVRASAAEPEEIDRDFTNTFRYDETIHALFASFEQPFDQWTMLIGLRLENVDFDVDQVTSDSRSSRSYFHAYPSIHVSRELDEQQSLTFSYARRVSRPFWQLLNPYRVRIDEFSANEGNQGLRPTKIDSIEAGWSYERGQRSLSATLYARRSVDNIQSVTTPINTTSVVTRPENVGESVAGGLELVATGRISPRVDFSLSANAYYGELDAGNLGFSGRRSTISYEGKAALNLRPGGKNRVQFNLASTGKVLTPQGYRQGSTSLDAGYRYQLRPNLSLVATVSDLFASRRNRVVLNTARYSSANEIEQPGRIVYVGVAWALMDHGDKAEKFEYDE